MIDILLADSDDLKAILALQKDCYVAEAELYNDFEIQPLTQDIESIETELKTCTILKGVVNGEIVASVRGYLKSGTCYIGKLMVRKDYQNRGIGSVMMNAIETMYKDCERFELFTGFKSEKNLYLYNKLGYKEYKREIMNEALTFIYLEKTIDGSSKNPIFCVTPFL